MNKFKKCIPSVLVLLIIHILSSCSYSAPIDQFLNTRVVSESPKLYFDIGDEHHVGQLTLEDGTTQDVELILMHGMFWVFELREDHSYSTEDKDFYRGPYTVKRDALILKDSDSGTEIHLKNTGDGSVS